jgi:predicted NUDIX family NTP pyrophosphohydrolase
VLLVHPGGPAWAKRDAGAWSIPKGEIDPGETLLAAARREFTEEVGLEPPEGDLVELGAIRQTSGKVVTAWAIEGTVDVTHIVSNRFEMEWPPRSGRISEYPEIDRAEWFDVDAAREKLNPAQVALLDRLLTKVP